MYFTVLENILTMLDMKLVTKASIFPLLDSLRNSFMGRLQYPHSYFMDIGCHSITFVTHGNDGKPNERIGRLADFINVLEKIVRISDQLDEQLHAGFYFYLLASPSKFVSNSVFMWPGVCLLLGILVPQFMAYATYISAKRSKDDSKGWSSQTLALVFLGLNYSMGLVFVTLPGYFLK